MEHVYELSGPLQGRIRLEYLSVAGYSMLQDRMRLCRELAIENSGATDWTDITASVEGPHVRPATARVERVAAGGSFACVGPAIEPDDATMEQLATAEGPTETAFTLTVRIGGREAVRAELPLTLRQPDADALHIDRPQLHLTKQHIWERKLLDFSLRNNLLNRKIGKRVIRLVADDVEAVEDRIAQGEDFTLVPRPEAAKDAKGKRDPKAEAEALSAQAAREIEMNRLMADMDEGELRTHLTFIYRTSRTAMEENGACALFLVLGVLRWYENDRIETPREAPLLLLPVDMVRKSGQNYVLRARDEEPILNITLIELLAQQFRIDLSAAHEPVLLRDTNGTLAARRILEIVAEAVGGMPRWQVLPLTELGIFYFNKFVMWNDIHQGAGRLAESEVVRSLMEGRVALTDIGEMADARAIDKTARPEEFAIPMDVDSSQMEAVVESGRGKSFILYGPPGTGKSQTITNMIANALYHGKRVLFVAEKMAALSVVQKRLEKIGIGAFCLELHSNKVTTQHLLGQMNRALEAVRVQEPDDYHRQSEELFASRAQLIAYMEALHRPQEGTGLSLYDCLSRYLAIEGGEIADGLPADVTAERLTAWREEIEGLDTVFRLTGHPAQHPLRGLNLREWSLASRDAVARLLPQLGDAVAAGEAQRSALLEGYGEAILDADPEALAAEWQDVAGRNFLVRLVKRGGYLRRFAARFAKAGAPRPALDAIPAALDRLRHYRRQRAVIDELHALADLDMPDAEAAGQAAAWVGHLDRGGKDWCQWTERKRRLEAEGLACVVQYLYHHRDADGRPPSPRAAADALQKGLYHRTAMQMIDADPQLRMFNGLLFEDLIARYRRQTARFQELTKQELYCRLAARIPSQTVAAAASSELGILKKAIAGGGRGTSIRRLIDQMPTLLPKLAPCMLMSPISVAQFLSLEGEKFDLVIFDEASQMPTSEAVGAIARGKALICVGDPKQMPPTSFFEKAQTDDEDDAALDDMDSILDDCIALSLPGHSLTWHYRSKHESLIAFSNREYYDGRLLTFPSVDDRRVKVSLVQLDGTYDKGRSRSNETEARAIVAETLRRLGDPELSRLSIGIVAFSKAQQDLIEDLLVEELAGRPDLERRAYEAEEPVFVKNLENVQGDERDVILFSIGYCPDRDGRVSMNFGPLNNEGGERRLNVAVSRARCEMTVFAILRAEQIDLTRTSAKGVEGLKRFLEFASGRRDAAAPAPAQTSPAAAPGSTDLAAQIGAALAERGYDVRLHVGRSDFKIDIAVVHPTRPDEYLLGIMCDGKNYYDTKTARDREICQPGVMTMLGWQTMRVWSIDWYEDRSKVIARLVARLEELRQADTAGTPSAPAPAAEPAVERFDPAKAALATDAAPAAGGPQPYVHAELKPVRKLPPFSETDGTVSRAVRDAIDAIVTAEQPVTNRLLYRRIAAHLGLPNGERLQRFIDWQLEPAYHRDPLSDGDDVPARERVVTWWKDAAARDAFVGFRTDSGRAWNEIPLREVVNAMRIVIDEQGRLPADDLKRAALRALGFARRTPRLDALTEHAMRALQDE